MTVNYRGILGSYPEGHSELLGCLSLACSLHAFSRYPHGDTVARLGSPSKQALRAQVFIDVWPMDAVAPAGQLPVRPLVRRRVQEPRIKGQRHRDRPAIGEGDDHAVVGAIYVRDASLRHF